MEGNHVSIRIEDDEIWRQRRARLKELELVNKPHWQTESKWHVNLQLRAAVKEGNVDNFINALESCTTKERISLSDIFTIEGPSGNSLLHVAAGIEKADTL